MDTKTVKIATSNIHFSILKRNFTILHNFLRGITYQKLIFCGKIPLIVPSLIQFSKHVGLFIYQKFWIQAWRKDTHFFSDFLFDLYINALTFDYVACYTCLVFETFLAKVHYHCNGKARVSTEAQTILYCFFYKISIFSSINY